MNAYEEISRRLLDRPLELKILKEEGVKIVAFNAGDYVPEELIYAAGAVPICQIHGGDPDSVEAAHSVATRFMCPFARAQIGYRWLKEQAYYDLPDLLMVGTTCQHLRKAGDVWNYFTDVNVFRLGVPQEYHTERALSYFIGSLKRMKETLEAFTGNEITEGNLRHSISLYNRMRELLKKINSMRRSSPSLIRSLDFIRLNHASYLADIRAMIKGLEKLLGELKVKEKAPLSERPRILLIAPNIALGDYKIFEIMEKAGADIVGEEVTEGVRAFEQNVETNGGDLLEALAVKYLRKRVPGAFMRYSLKPRFEHALDLARQLDVQGIVWYQLKMCETYDIEAVYFAKHLREHNLPMLKLDSEYDVSDRGPIRTRIEAFLESIQRR